MVARNEAEAFTESSKPRRKGLLSRFKRNKTKQPQSKSLEAEDPVETSSDEGMMMTTPPCTPPPVSNSLVSRGGRVDIPPPLVGQSRLPTRSFVKIEQPPTAREAAFSGPPRYDWIDIVSILKANVLLFRFFGRVVCWTKAYISIHTHSRSGNGCCHQGPSCLSPQQGLERLGRTGCVDCRYSQPCSSSQQKAQYSGWKYVCLLRYGARLWR